MHRAGFAGTAGFAGRGDFAGGAGFAERDDDGGNVSAVVDPSVEGAWLGTVRLQLTVWEQWA